MSKSTKPHPSFYNNNFYYMVYLSTEENYTTFLTKHYATMYHIQGIEDMVSDRWSKEVHRYQIEALNGIHHWEDARQDFFKAEIINTSPGKVYFDKKIISVIQENVIDMVNNNELSHGIARLKGRDWNDKEIKRSIEMLNKID
ncbi:hypothetical protein Tco_0286252 [Tanacetum coccineum]